MRIRIALIVLAMLPVFFVGSSTPKQADAAYYANDGSQVKDFALLRVGNMWHVISIHVPDSPPPGTGSPGLVHATARDFNYWHEEGIAVPVGATGAWDSYDIWAPSIVKSGDTYYLFYAGVQQVGNQPVQKIGLATSTDLYTWTKYDQNPVFDCTTLAWTYVNPTDTRGVGAECRDPYVTWDATNSRWMMFYTARSLHINQDPLTGVEHPAVVGTAYSADLIHWTDSGALVSTGGNKAESPHAFFHAGTWYLVWTNDCTFDYSTKCLQYATSTTLTGPYETHQDIPELYWAYFASEYYKDGIDEYFAYDVSNALDFKRISWVGGTPSFTAPPGGSAYGGVFLDTNGNGIQDGAEDGVNRVQMKAWYDDGDGLFDRAHDHNFYTLPTMRTKRLVTMMNGTYRYSQVWPDTMWVEVAASNFDPSGVLYGLQSTTGGLVTRIEVTDGTSVEGASFGFAPPDVTAPFAVDDLRISPG